MTARLALLLGGLLLSLGAAAPPAHDSFVLRNVAIHPISAPDIESGMLVVQGGKIAAFGASGVPVPKGARVIDAKGLHVYPGMIDSATQMGLTEVSAVRETVDTNELGDFNPQLRAEIAINPGSEHIAVTRAGGITSVITAPQGGIISGQAALIHLDGWTWEDMDIRRSAGMAMVMPVISSGGGRGGGMGMGTRPSFAELKRNHERRLAEMREFFENARRYQQAKAAARPGFENNLKYEAMLPVLEGKVPVVILAVRERAIRDAVEFAEQQKLRLVLAGCREVEKVAADLKAKSIPVILGPTHEPPLNEDDPYDASFSLPATLHKAGVKFAFGSFTTSSARTLPDQVATAVAYGLPHQEGLKAITINPAEIWGVAGEYGSIEKGKWADLILTDGDLLETRTQVKRMFIRGRPANLENNKHYQLYQKYLAKP